MAAVATATSSVAPSSRAARAWRSTTSTVSSIFAGGITPSLRDALPSRVNARSVISSRSDPVSASATSRRVVLLPMSMQPQITGK